MTRKYIDKGKPLPLEIDESLVPKGYVPVRWGQPRKGQAYLNTQCNLAVYSLEIRAGFYAVILAPLVGNTGGYDSFKE
jgi:hypothetical protein